MLSTMNMLMMKDLPVCNVVVPNLTPEFVIRPNMNGTMGLNMLTQSKYKDDFSMIEDMLSGENNFRQRIKIWWNDKKRRSWWYNFWVKYQLRDFDWEEIQECCNDPQTKRDRNECGPILDRKAI